MTLSGNEIGEESTYESWSTLREAVDDFDGVLRVPMWRLRDLAGAGRLGIHVRAEISRKLAGHGLAHLPAELPGDQNYFVILYRLGTPAADVVTAVLSNDTHRGASALRRLNASRDTEKLQVITEKLAELTELVTNHGSR